MRIVGYGLFTAAGAATLLWPAPNVSAATGWLAYVWAGFLAAGGMLSAGGAITDRWIGESVGLPLLIAAFAVYAVIIAASGRLTSIAGALVLAGIGAALAARWQDIAGVRREAIRAAREGTR